MGLLSGLSRGVLMAAAALVVPAMVVAGEMRLSGAGATFPEPIYRRWVVEFEKVSPDVKIDYRGIGSGGGIKAITDKTVAFAASDAPLNKKEMEALGGDAAVVQFPLVAGGVVPAYNLPGVDAGTPVNFTGEILADIYRGVITMWNDPRLVEINAGVKLPALAITPAWRSDGSGTTFVFTNYLATQSEAFKGSIGTGKSVKWPIGQGGKGNPGVAAIVTQTAGALGYIEQNFAVEAKVAFGAVKNAAGRFVKASPASVAAAGATAVDEFKGRQLTANIWNRAGEGTYPISAFTYVIAYGDLSNLASADEAKGLVRFFRWAASDAQHFAKEMEYAPLEAPVRERVLAALGGLTFKGETISPGEGQAGKP